VCPEKGRCLSVVFIAVLVPVVAVFLAFLFFLVFCAFVVVRTGGTSGLRDVAVAVRAFRGVLSLRRGRES
jgi:hypothetical protein